MRKPMRLLAALLLFFGIVLVPSPAFAAESWLGNNYALDLNSSWDVGICDGEDDGRGVYVEFYRVNGQFHDFRHYNGPNLCRYTTDGQALGSRVRSLRVCEDVPWAWDPCGSWVFTPYA